MPTFDIVSKYNVQEVENTINMVVRDIANRYDFKGSQTSINFNKKDKFIKIEANSEMHLDSVKDMLEKRAVGRSLSLKIFKYNEFEKASGMQVKLKIDLQEGISHDNAKIVNKLIKDSKLKVQSQIQGDQIRVSGKKIDDLQNVIELLKNKNLNFSLQFINMKK